MFPDHILLLAQEALAAARAKNLRIAVAESCTGGLVCACLTEIAGSSYVLDRGFVTYSNDAKMQNLGVSRKTLADYGAVSAETALEMVEGALSASHADVAVAITGIAGPSGGSAEKPAGLVYIASARNRHMDPAVAKNLFQGDRAHVRMASVEMALVLLKKEISLA